MGPDQLRLLSRQPFGGNYCIRYILVWWMHIKELTVDVVGCLDGNKRRDLFEGLRRFRRLKHDERTVNGQQLLKKFALLSSSKWNGNILGFSLMARPRFSTPCWCSHHNPKLSLFNYLPEDERGYFCASPLNYDNTQPNNVDFCGL
jgi:hypothetical protein